MVLRLSIFYNPPFTVADLCTVHKTLVSRVEQVKSR